MTIIANVYLQELLEINNLLEIHDECYLQYFQVMKITTQKNKKNVYFLVDTDYMIYFYSYKSKILNVISIYFCNSFIVSIYAMQNNIWQEIM